MTVGSSTTTTETATPTATATHAYGEPAYWDNRYRHDPGPFDWYQKYKTLAPLFDLYVQRSDRILLVGCGNSALGGEMVGDGYQDLVNVDISSVVVEAMQQKYHDQPQMKYIQMDVRNMTGFESAYFDAVIDKGTLDSLMCGYDAQINAKRMLEEGSKDKGVYILITYGDPSYRLYLLREIRLWNISMHVIDRAERTSERKSWDLTTPLTLNEDGSSVTTLLGPNPEVHYIYVCTKDDSLRKQRI